MSKDLDMALTKHEFLYEYYIKVEDLVLRSELQAEGLLQEAGKISQGKLIEYTLKTGIQSDKYLHFFEWDFEKVWEEMGYKGQFEKYQDDFNKRALKSLDVSRMIDQAIKENEIKTLEYDEVIRQLDRISRGQKLGYSFAINGENPDINDIIFNIKYSTTYGLMQIGEQKKRA